MKIRGIGKERIFKYINGKICVWDSSTTPWTKIYITAEEYEKLSKQQDSDTINIPM